VLSINVFNDILISNRTALFNKGVVIQNHLPSSLRYFCKKKNHSARFAHLMLTLYNPLP